MQELILKLVLKAVQEVASSEQAKELYDDMLDWLEDYIADSETQIDDVLILPLIRQIRSTLNIPDGED